MRDSLPALTVAIALGCLPWRMAVKAAISKKHVNVPMYFIKEVLKSAHNTPIRVLNNVKKLFS